jgi:hypothetical protein
MMPETEGNFRVRIIVEDEFEGMCAGIAAKEAEQLAREIRSQHLVSATVESVVEMKEEE